MDSDSSLDGNFETRDEVAARNGRKPSQADSCQDQSSGSDSSLSLDEDEGNAPAYYSGETPKSPIGESNSVLSREDAQSQSSYSSRSSATEPPSPPGEVKAPSPDEEKNDDNDENDLGDSDKFEKKEDGECEGSREGYSEVQGFSTPPPADDDAGDLSDVSDMDSRDSLEAVFAQDCKVKDEETRNDRSSPADDSARSAVGKEEDEDGEDSSDPKPPSPQHLPPPPVQQHIETEQLDFEAEEQVKEVSCVADDKEEGECEERVVAQCDADSKADDKSDGELKEGEDLEEGELTDEDETRPGEMEPRPVCRFYNRGQCTWGSSCRFVHPGVTDKGNYTMFEIPRALLPVNGPGPVYSPDYRIPYEKPYQPVVPFQAPPRKEETAAPVFESAWERGLRHAKEMMRKATKRKEMDIDFEEKKMNLSLGQEELDKENDYYTRPATPVIQTKDDPNHWCYDDASELYHVGMGSAIPSMDLRQQHHHHGASQPAPPQTIPSGGDYWRRVHYEGADLTRSLRVETDYVGRGSAGISERKERSREGRDLHRHHHHHHAPEPSAHVPSSGRAEQRHMTSSQGRSESRGDHHATERRKKAVALPGVTRSSANSVAPPSVAPSLPPEKTSTSGASTAAAAWRDDKYPGVPPVVTHSHKARGDEWADPWMRSKSPTRRSASGTAPSGIPTATVRPTRHQQSFSSGSTYSSSSSSSRSSSRSSYSSFSSRSRSPRPVGGAPVPARPAHQSRSHAIPVTSPINHQQGPQRTHHRGGPSSGPVVSRLSSPPPSVPLAAAPRTPPLPPLPPPPSSKSRSRSPMSRSHRRRVNANSGMPVSGSAVMGRQPVHIQLSPRHGTSVTSVPPPRKVGRPLVLSPTHGERKGSGGLSGPAPGYSSAAMMTAIRGGSGLVREPSPQLVRKVLHATAIPMPQPSPRIMGSTTRAPQAAVAVAAAAAKSATEHSLRHHRRRHQQHGRSGHGRHRSSTSHRSQSSSHSSRSEDDDDDNSGSGSSSDSSDSSGSSTSSTSSSSSSSSDASGEARKKPSPQARPKRFLIDDRAAIANSMKVKAMDALKLSGQKQQIKLTLKPPGSGLIPGKRPMLDMPEPLAMRNRDRPMNLPLMAGKKRPAPESPPSPVEPTQPAPKLIVGSMPKAAAKKAPSRREELLKQLKAVEDAIARKRSKITFPGTS